MKVQDVLDILCEAFPLEDADSWDNPGLSVGNPADEVTAIATALDVTPTNIKKASEIGCNLLVTHHPIFIQAPQKYSPQIATSSLSGECVWLAAHLGVSVISMHTNLDKSSKSMSFLADLLGFEWVGRLEDPNGFGAIMNAGGLSYDELAGHCAKVFSTQPTIWKPQVDSSSTLTRVVYCSGSTGDLGEIAIANNLDCIICGECGYHKCLELNEAGIGVILLGHDASEVTFAQLLANIIQEAASNSCIHVLEEPRRWRVLA